MNRLLQAKKCRQVYSFSNTVNFIVTHGICEGFNGCTFFQVWSFQGWKGGERVIFDQYTLEPTLMNHPEQFNVLQKKNQKRF